MEARPRLAPRGYALAAIAAALAAAGSVPGLDGLLAAGLAAAGFLAAHRAASAAALLAAARLRVERLVEGRRVEGEPHRVRLRVCNPTPVPLPGLLVEDRPPPDAAAEPQPRALAPLPPRGCASIEYTVTPRLGVNRWEPPRLRLEDPLGLVRPIVFQVEPRGTVALTAAARVPVRGLAALLRGLATLAEAGTAAARAGRGTVFLELRDYHPDDDPRLIDWKASARTGRLLVKVMEAEHTAPTLVVLHLPAWSLQARGPGDTAGEAAARLAAALTAALASTGAAARLLAIGPGGAADTGWQTSPRAAARAAAHTAAKAAGERRGPTPTPREAASILARASTPRRPGLAVLITPGGAEAAHLLAALKKIAQTAAATAPPGDPPAPGQLEAWRRAVEELAHTAGIHLPAAAPGGAPTPRLAAALAAALTRAPAVAAKGAP